MLTEIETLHEMAEARCPILGGRQPEARAAEWALKEIDRLRGLLGEPLRVIAVEAIREATGCPDLIGRDSEKLTEKLLKKAAELLVPNK